MWLCVFVCVHNNSEVMYRSFKLFLCPDQRKKCTNFVKDLDYILDKNKIPELFKISIFKVFQRLWLSG